MIAAYGLAFQTEEDACEMLNIPYDAFKDWQKTNTGGYFSVQDYPKAARIELTLAAALVDPYAVEEDEEGAYVPPYSLDVFEGIIIPAISILLLSILGIVLVLWCLSSFHASTDTTVFIPEQGYTLVATSDGVQEAIKDSLADNYSVYVNGVLVTVDTKVQPNLSFTAVGTYDVEGELIAVEYTTKWGV